MTKQKRDHTIAKGLIVSAIGYLSDKLFLSKIQWDNLRIGVVGDFLNKNINIQVYQVLFFFLFLIPLFLLVRKIKFNKNKSESLSSKQIRFREQFKKFEDQVNDLVFRLDIFFPNHDKPAIAEVEAFCNKHDYPLRFVDGNCPKRDCPNSRIKFNKFMEKNAMESKLLDLWDNY